MPTIEQRLLEGEHILQFDVIITKEELLSEVQKEVRKIAKGGKMKGFRPGHAPIEMVRSMYGESILRTTFQHKLEEGLKNFEQSERSYPVIGPPLLADQKSAIPTPKLKNLHDEYRIAFEVGLFPKTLEGLSPEHEYEMIVVDIPDEVAAKDLADIALRYGTEKEVTDAAALKDTLEIELVELDGGQSKEGGWQQESFLALSEKLPEEILNAFVGRSPNDVVRVRLAALLESGATNEYRRLLRLSDEEQEATFSDWFEVTIRRILRDEPAEMTEAFFQEHFGEGVRTEQEALAAIKRAIQAMYERFVADDLMHRVLERLGELNDIPWPHRYMRAFFTERHEKSPDEDPEEYEAFLNWHKRFFFVNYLRKLTNAYPSDEEIVKEIADRAYAQLSRFGLEHMLNSFVSRMVKDPESVEDARAALIVRKVASGLPSLVTIRERHMAIEEVDKQLQEIRTRKAPRLAEHQQAFEPEASPVLVAESAPNAVEPAEEP